MKKESKGKQWMKKQMKQEPEIPCNYSLKVFFFFAMVYSLYNDTNFFILKKKSQKIKNNIIAVFLSSIRKTEMKEIFRVNRDIRFNLDFIYISLHRSSHSGPSGSADVSVVSNSRFNLKPSTVS